MRIATICTAGAAALAVLLCGCSAGTISGRQLGSTSGTAGTPTSPTGFPSTSSAPAPTTGESGTPPTSASSAGSTDLSAALLRASDLSGFSDGQPDATSSPLPCTPAQPPLETQVPPQGKADSTVVSDSGQSGFKEGIYTFASTTTAAAFVAMGSKGFACSSAKFSGHQAKIVGPYKPAVTSPSDQDLAWDLAISDGSYATVSLTRVGQKVIGLVFYATKAGQTEIAPTNVIELALDKLAAHS